MGFVRRWSPAGVWALAMAGAVVSRASEAKAELPRIEPFDVPTVFYISKSDDGSRVDYGLHLDERCAPRNDDAIYLYWHEFDNHPPTMHTLGTFEYIPYGVVEQRAIRKGPVGGEYMVRLRQFANNPIGITTQKGPDGKCTAVARAIIHGKVAQLLYVFAQLQKSFPWPTVQYVDVHGRDFGTGQDVVERIVR